jgi:tellurite resistance protein TehA-like permease
MIIFTILFTRFILLRFISHSNLFPGLFVAPRGLITIVLFYSIPPFLKHPAFNEGILFFVIILSAILMMVGLLAARTEYKEPIDELNH